VHRQVLKHEAEGGGGIFQVMDKKKRTWPGKPQSSRACNSFWDNTTLRKAGRHLIPDTFKEIEILLGKRHAANAITQHHEPEYFPADHHWHTDTASAFVKLIWMATSESGGPNFLLMIRCQRDQDVFARHGAFP